MIEAYFPHRLEVRIVSIFGRVMLGGTDCGLRIDREGRILSGDREEKWMQYVNVYF